MGRSMKNTEPNHGWDVIFHTQDTNLFFDGWEPPYEDYVLRAEAEERLDYLEDRIAELERRPQPVLHDPDRLSEVERSLESFGYQVDLFSDGIFLVKGENNVQAQAKNLDQLRGVLSGVILESSD